MRRPLGDGPRSRVTSVKAKSLVQLSDKYTRYATVYGCLVIVGAILLGWNAGATVTWRDHRSG